MMKYILFALLLTAPLYGFAGYDEENGHYILDTKEALAPAADTPTEPYAVEKLDLYEWLYRVAPVVKPSDLGDDDIDLFIEDLKMFAEERAEEEGITYEEALAKEFEMEFANSTLGPYVAPIWKQFASWRQLEQNHEQAVSNFTANKEQWIREKIATQILREKIFKDEINELDNSVKEYLLARKDAKDTKNPSLEKAIVDWEHREAKEVYETFLAQWIETYARSEAALSELKPSQELAIAADLEFQQELDALKWSKYFPAHINKSLMNMEETEAGKIEVDFYNSFADRMAAEANPNFEIKKTATIGFETYSIIPASIDAVLSVYNLRNGINSQRSTADTSVYYPIDDLFNYRREQSFAKEKHWGKGAWVNYSLKAYATMPFVNNSSDAFVVLVRGNNKDGYDIYLSYLGNFCPKDANENWELGDKDNCSTKTESRFSILSLRPMGPNKTAYRMVGSQIGQSYGFLDKLGWQGTRSIGFSKDKLLSGQTSFNNAAIYASNTRSEIAATMGKSAVALNWLDLIISTAEANSKKVISIHSEAGYFLDLNDNIVKLGAGEAKDPSYRSISIDQNWVEIEGKLFKPIMERGSEVYSDGQSYNDYQLNKLFEN